MTDQVAYLSSTLRVDQEFSAAFGYFMVAFSRCEEAVNHTTCTLLGIQGHSGGLEVIAAVRDFGQRIMLLNRLSKRVLSTDVEIKQFGRTISALTYLNDHRVNLVHGEIGTALHGSDSTNVMRTVAQQSAVGRRVYQFSPDFLLDLASYAVEVEKALSIFRINFRSGLDREMPSLDNRP